MASALLILILDPHRAGIAISMALLGLSMGISGPGFSASISLAVGADEQGGVAGLACSVPAISFILGPLIGAGLYQIEPLLPYAVTLAALVPGCLLVFRLPVAAR